MHAAYKSSSKKANEQAPWTRKKSSKESSPAGSRTNSCHPSFLNDWTWSSFKTPSKNETSPGFSRTNSNSNHSYMTSPSPPHLHSRESYSSGSDRNSIKSPRCRKIKSPFGDNSVLPSKPCVNVNDKGKRAPPSTKEIAEFNATLTNNYSDRFVNPSQSKQVGNFKFVGNSTRSPSRVSRSSTATSSEDSGFVFK